MSEKNEPELLLESRIFNVVRKTRTDDDGREHIRDIIIHPGAVVILPMLEDDRVVLIENYRVAADDWLIELPAGTREPNEPPQETALRELVEETGYRAGSIRHLTTFYTSPGILREEMFLYEATDLTPGEMDLDAGEQIRPMVTPLSEALEMVWSGKIRDAKTIAGLLWRAARRDL